jgi:hypothetical protein
MKRPWRRRVLIGTAIVVALGAGGTAVAMAAEPGGSGAPVVTTGNGIGGPGETSVISAAGNGPVITVSAGPGAPAPERNAYVVCLKGNGGVVRSQAGAGGRRTVTVTVDPSKRSHALTACRRYAPAGASVSGRPVSLTPLNAAQNATVTKCLNDSGVAFPAPGVKQTLGLAPAGTQVAGGDGPAPRPADGKLIANGNGVVVNSIGTPPSASPGAPNPKIIASLGKCAQVAGLPGIGLSTQSGQGTVTSVVTVGAAA